MRRRARTEPGQGSLLVVPDPAGVTRAVRLGIALDGIVPVRAQQGLVLRCAREARGMTQDDVARIAGCSRATVQRIEAGDQPPGGRIGELLTAVGVPHADLR